MVTHVSPCSVFKLLKLGRSLEAKIHSFIMAVLCYGGKVDLLWWVPLPTDSFNVFSAQMTQARLGS